MVLTENWYLTLRNLYQINIPVRFITPPDHERVPIKEEISLDLCLNLLNISRDRDRSLGIQSTMIKRCWGKNLHDTAMSSSAASCAAPRCQHSSSIAAQFLTSDLSTGVTASVILRPNLTLPLLQRIACVLFVRNIPLSQIWGSSIITWWHAVLENASRSRRAEGRSRVLFYKVSEA